MRTIEIRPAYFKQGDDFAHFLASNNVPAALMQWTSALVYTADQLKQVAGIIADYPEQVNGRGDAHLASVTVPDECAERLLELDICGVPPLEDSEFEEDRASDATSDEAC